MYYYFNRLIRLALTCFVLYLIFTNFGTFLLIIGVIVVVFLIILNIFLKKVNKSGFYRNFSYRNQGPNSFRFDSSNFDFNSEEFRKQYSSYNQQASLGDIEKAKAFFGFTGEFTKDDIKKRYKELARKYHPDIQGGSEEKMKELNNYKDVLMHNTF